ncbi:MAG TPA: DUF692 domain-containing protein [Myxococcota bacterium]|nr:DUF692 domain-containing protein [Myxococcota bacterium]
MLGAAVSGLAPGAFPYLGHGIGLRLPHHGEFMGEAPPPVDWLEVVSENFMVPGGRPLHVLDTVRARYPVVLHGVSLSIGATEPLDDAYLVALARLAHRVEPAWISDHLCWGSHGGRYGHDLWPLPYTEEALAHVVERVEQVQERLGRHILLENVSSYVTFTASAMPEWEFLSEVAERADCGILCDVNNIYVSARNHGFAPETYVDGLPPQRIGQVHLAGHDADGPLLIDTHGAPVADAVWALYRRAVARFGPVSTLVEWDEDVPPLDVVLAESVRARREAAGVLSLRRRQEGDGRGATVWPGDGDVAVDGTP